MRISDWSSDVCSSDLVAVRLCGVLGALLGDQLFLRQLADEGLRQDIAELHLARHLHRRDLVGEEGAQRLEREALTVLQAHEGLGHLAAVVEIGRASGRERGWQYV